MRFLHRFIAHFLCDDYSLLCVDATADYRISDLEPVLDGTFGETHAPVFLDGVGCKGMERKLVDCDRYPRLGFIDERCACNEENCVEDLGVRCPGKYCYL